jgi:hypothetical protein
LGAVSFERNAETFHEPQPSNSHSASCSGKAMTLHNGLLAMLLLVWAAGNTALASIESAAVMGGTVKGQVIDGIGIFKGIPFAAPPVGNLR